MPGCCNWPPIWASSTNRRHDLRVASVRSQQHLDRQVTAEVDVAPLEDGPHTAAGDFTLELETPDAGAVVGHRGRSWLEQRLRLLRQLAEQDLRRLTRAKIEGGERAEARSCSLGDRGIRPSLQDAEARGHPPGGLLGHLEHAETGAQIVGEVGIPVEQPLRVGRLAGLDAARYASSTRATSTSDASLPATSRRGAIDESSKFMTCSPSPARAPAWRGSTACVPR